MHAHGIKFKRYNQTFLVVQWLRLQVLNAGGTDLIPGQGTKIPTCCMGSQISKRYKMLLLNCKS